MSIVYFLRMESNELIQVNMDNTKIASPMNTLMILKTGLNFIHIRATNNSWSLDNVRQNLPMSHKIPPVVTHDDATDQTLQTIILYLKISIVIIKRNEKIKVNNMSTAFLVLLT